jgi:REP element-mobilizing transposase RayT
MDNAVNLSPQGKIVEEHWYDLPNHYQNCRLDEFVIMPNHIHGIIEIRYHDDTRTFTNTVETGLKPVSTINDETVGKQHSLFEIIRGFKTFSARRINKYQNTVGLSFWQARFYDHIIRNEKSLNNIRRYIQNNPLKWSMDKYNPDHKEWRHCDN